MGNRTAMISNIPGAHRALAESIAATLWQWAYMLERRRSEHAEPIARAARDALASPMEHAIHGRSAASVEAALGDSPGQCAGGLTRLQWLQIRHGALPWLQAMAGNRVAAKVEIDARAAEQTERIALRKRVAELEAENERLRTAIAALRKPRP